MLPKRAKYKTVEAEHVKTLAESRYFKLAKC